MNIDVGQIIAGKYELIRLLGKGAMGEVWLAKHDSLGGEFAIKLVEPTDDIEAETAAGRFQLEAQIAAKLSRKTRHIVSVSDHGEENGLAYLVMELLEGESLEQKTKRLGRLEDPEVAAIVSQVARALSLAHEEGVFHRDLKPANVWLARDEDGRLLAKLLDFGIARSNKPIRTRSPFATSKDMVLGTPSYMSPEQARGLDSLDYRCDLWALAVVAYEALTKKIPFEGETVEDIFLSICTFRVVPALTRRPDLPPIIEAFFARAFASKLDDRFGTAAELTEAFEQLVTPEELEVALGLPPTPTSARRLESAPRVGSNPNLTPHAAAAVLAPPPSSDPIYGGGGGGGGAMNGGAAMAPRVGSSPRLGSSPDFDPENGPSVDPMSVGIGMNGTLGIPKRNNGIGWAIGIAGVILLLGVGVLGVITFRGSSKNVSTTQPTDTTTSSSSPSLTTTAPTTSPPASASSVVPIADTTTAPLPPNTGKTGPVRPVPPTTKTTGAGVTTPPTQPPAIVTPAHAPTAPAPTPTTAKSVNKGEVF